MFKFSELEYIQVEVTNNCQASCPMCPRMHEGNVNPKLPIASWTLDEYKTILNSTVLKQVKAIELCGNFGDPLLNKELLDMCEYTRSVSETVFLLIKTNGSIRTTEWWADFARVLKGNAVVVFAIDGLEDTNHIYRIGTNFNKILDNAKAFIEAGGSATWEMLLFEHNEHQVEDARQLSKELGFHQFMAKASSRFKQNNEFPVKDKEGNVLYTLKPFSKNEVSFISKEVLANYKQLVEQAEIDCKVCKTKEIYIDAYKTIFPCVWTGKVLYNSFDDAILEVMTDSYNQLTQLMDSIGGIDKLNALHGVQDVIDSDMWQTMWTSKWQNPDKLIVCAKSCNKQRVGYSDKFLNE